MPLCPKCQFRWVSTTRSNQQNRYYWGVIVEMLAEELGYSREEIHEILKHKFLIPKSLMGENIYPNTAQLTTTEFNLYNEKIKRWAAMELSVVIPDPHEETNKKFVDPQA